MTCPGSGGADAIYNCNKSFAGLYKGRGVQGKAAKRRRWRSKRAAFEAAARFAAPQGAGNRNAATVVKAPGAGRA